MEALLHSSPSLVSFSRVFAKELRRYEEISMSSTDARLGIMTQSSGEAFSRKVSGFLREAGLRPGDLDVLESWAKRLGPINLFLKVEAGPGAPPEYSFYFRRRPEIPTAIRCLEEAGLAAAQLSLVQEMAAILHKRTVHFLAASTTATGPTQLKVYFSQPIEEESIPRIRSAFQHAGLDRKQMDFLASFSAGLAHKPLFFSVGLEENQADATFKLDIAEPGMELSQHIMRQAGLPVAQIKRLTSPPYLNKPLQLHYIAVGFRQQQTAGFKVYWGADQDTE